MGRPTLRPKETRYDVPKWGWAVPYTSPTGVQTTLYGIGTVADALGRTPQTIRKWEIGGVIPLTPFKIGGRRMYSDEHIDALVFYAEKSHIRPGVSISNTAFSKNVYKKYEELYKYFFVKDNQ